MEMQTTDLLPEYSFSGFKLNSLEDTEKLYVWYKKPQGGQIVEFNFPKTITIDSRFIQNLALYIGDGLNNPSKINTHCNFSNNNLDLIKLIYDWWLELGIQKEKINVYACTSEGDMQEIENIIKNKIKCEKVKVYVYPLHRIPTIIIQIGNSIFQAFFLNLFTNLKSKIFADVILRRAFLTGLFAAEGHVKHSVYGTIESISYAFNPKTELALAKFVCDCLSLENITAKISKGQVYFCNYAQMLRFFLRGIINLHKNKKIKFEKLIKNADVTLHFNQKFLEKAINKNISQHKLAKNIGCSQASISHNLTISRFKLKLLPKICPNITRESLVENTEYAQVSNSRISDKEAITFLINIQLDNKND